MTLATGQRLGRYEIVAPLGAGGMGEVYRAPNMAYLSIMPRIHPELAGNPRFEAIVRRMGFPQPPS